MKPGITNFKYLSLLLLAGCLSLAGCYTQQPLTNGPSQNNDTYKVQYLFEHEGCKVYRFYDRGQYVYFTNCNGQAIAQTDSTTVTNSIRVNPN